MAAGSARDEGRLAYAHQAWQRAGDLLAAAERDGPDEPADLVRRATAAYLAGDDASAALWERAFQAHQAAGDVGGAALCAFWLGRDLVFRGEVTLAGGWFARAGRLLAEDGGSYVAAGYLEMGRGIQRAQAGDAVGAARSFDEAAETGRVFGDRDLEVWAQHGQGRMLLTQGRVEDGLAILDEVLVAMTSGELSPILTGDVYCSVIDGLQEVFDLRRAVEWTAALSRWCDGQPELVAYRGRCLVHRAEILHLRGSWSEAMALALDACERLVAAAERGNLAAAHYEQAELHRLRGEFLQAEDGYRAASRGGRSAQPGLALVRRSQGRTAEAAAALRTSLEEPTDLRHRRHILAAAVEVLLADGDVEGASAAADELSRHADETRAPMLAAMAAYAAGAVLLAQGDARGALPHLRSASARWREVDVPYEVARTCVLVGLACRALGDEDTARLELDAARSAFTELGAAPDATRLAELAQPEVADASSGLTVRELQVLRLVAQGRSNRAIAAELVISERTVARHVSNIFTKLGVSSRSAATAYAYDHQLR